MVIGWTFHTSGVLMLRCLAVITTVFRLCVHLLCPLLSAANTSHAPIISIFFSCQIHQVPLHNSLYWRKKRGEHKGKIYSSLQIESFLANLSKKERRSIIKMHRVDHEKQNPGFWRQALPSYEIILFPVCGSTKVNEPPGQEGVLLSLRWAGILQVRS